MPNLTLLQLLPGLLKLHCLQRPRELKLATFIHRQLQKVYARKILVAVAIFCPKAKGHGQVAVCVALRGHWLVRVTPPAVKR